ncbi:MAG: hypothetical protein AB1772_09245 [Candidatus Zixiibacteriota bacterium]
MKVNPLGIQAYQNLNRQERQSLKTDSARAGEALDRPVVIEPQSAITKSTLAIKAPSGSYAKFLSAEERQALDLLFARFGDTGRFGAAYAADAETADAAGLGRIVDVKV